VTGPPEHVVDLRSDTVTRPTRAMRTAMAEADVGDDVYGEDPTVNELESVTAALLGHEAGLFTPTGSLANQLGLRLLVAPGQELVCDDDAHVVRAELGAAAALGGITTRTWRAPRGALDPAAVARIIRPDAGPYLVSTAAVAVENTHNFGGGTVQPLDTLREVRALADEAGIALHLDGARLFNAHVATGVPLDVYGSLFDTVSVCLSKGLGAPVGSVLVASAERIATARVWRKRLGAGMRQVGVLAAGGSTRWSTTCPGSPTTTAGASAAEAVAAVAPAAVDAGAVDTNIVMLDVPDAAGLAAACAAEGVRISVLGPRVARVVTHLDVDDADVEHAAKVLSAVLERDAG
jgi:threonine aldolase